MNVFFRTPYESDMDFIVKKIRRKYSQYSLEGRYLIQSLMEDSIRQMLATLIAAGMDILICCNPEEMTEVYGFVIYCTVNDKKVVHYIFVKEEHREKGMAKAMMKKAFPNYSPFDQLYITTITPIADKIRMAKRENGEDLKYRLFYLPNLLFQLAGFGHIKNLGVDY